MEKRELDALPDRIESLETRQQELFQIMSDGDFYRQDGEVIAAVQNELTQVEKDLEDAFTRWEALDKY
jgi:ATP-binding cassette subfamily F protein uup